MMHTFHISNLHYFIHRNSQFEISTVYDIGFERNWDLKIRVCGKDSIPLTKIWGMKNKSNQFFGLNIKKHFIILLH